jgi:hypothetical protein
MPDRSVDLRQKSRFTLDDSLRFRSSTLAVRPESDDSGRANRQQGCSLTISVYSHRCQHRANDIIENKYLKAANQFR